MSTSPMPPSNVILDRRLTVLETRFDTILPTLATKQDLAELRSDYNLLRVDFGMLRGEFEKLRGEFEKLRGEFEKLRGEFEKLWVDVVELLNAQLKWMMALFVTFFLGVAGLNYSFWTLMERCIDVRFRALALAQEKSPPAASQAAAPVAKSSAPLK